MGSRSGFAQNGGGRRRRTQAREDRSGDKQGYANDNLGRECRAERSDRNDMRMDTKTGHAFITESGTGAIIVVDLKSGQAP